MSKPLTQSNLFFNNLYYGFKRPFESLYAVTKSLFMSLSNIAKKAIPVITAIGNFFKNIFYIPINILSNIVPDRVIRLCDDFKHFMLRKLSFKKSAPESHLMIKQVVVPAESKFNIDTKALQDRYKLQFKPVKPEFADTRVGFTVTTIDDVDKKGELLQSLKVRDLLGQDDPVSSSMSTRKYYEEYMARYHQLGISSQISKGEPQPFIADLDGIDSSSKLMSPGGR